ncbi:MAG TPA: LysR family transcriptional regulator [Verrucomicrobiota bacterium]|nr:LysR family transcriptional regulator [Verrucomicrobiota bacterium]HOP97642.1 LysR family transcriptional regulator [Verrucomicrobiota bacterium]HPU55553.1 LysR family transcriptional regulator [Verrucomicrobiota bacterium]
MNAPLDSRQLLMFCVLSRTGSFTQTARELRLTQSAVSHAMKALEGDVGCRLLDKMGKKVVLTQAGEQLLHHAGRILEEMHLARESLARLGKWGRGRLRLGASTSVCQHILPTVIRDFKAKFPGHTVTLEPGDTPAAVSALLRQRMDLAFALEPGNEPQLEFRQLFSDELQFIVAPTHPWTRAGRAERDQVPRQNYILYSKSSLTFRLIDRYWRQERLALNTVMELGSMEAIKELVKLGLGVSILAPWIAKKEIEEGSLVALPLGRRKLERRWGILHWRGRRLTLAEETFVGLCQAACAGFSAKPAGSGE